MNPSYDPETDITTLNVDEDDIEQTDAKFVVFKRSDFDEFLNDCRSDAMAAPGAAKWLETVALLDAVVIRTQDRFAGPALHAYSQSIALVASVSPADRHNLLGAADYMHRRAVEADEIARAGAAKFPD